ncbi:hypothetical protein N7449_008681 [Penicillium cf. viridicatum]|uniref:RING-type domain-containing protein n=1 Tax=Penicillium cf. viridicatum TaxID=2972119 RepID=A0A9W9J8M9_9EURO|nr:hypothetical protein N7449_008681 [Penicillium cf. viridicatum]
MEQHDLLLIVDVLSYRGCYVRSLTASLPEILSIFADTGCFSRIGVLAYRDYQADSVLEWSGWLNQGQHESSQEPHLDLIAFAKRLRKNGTRNYGAVKTALAKACQVMRADAKTLIFLYAETCPTPSYSYGSNLCRLKGENNLMGPRSYSGYGPAFIDWVSACNTLRDGPKQAQVFSILNEFMELGDADWYNYLCTRTDGVCVHVKSHLARDIAKVTVGLLLAWMGVDKAPSASDKVQAGDISAELLRYISASEIDSPENEESLSTFPYCSIGSWVWWEESDNITRVKLTVDVMKRCVPQRTAPMPDFTEEITSMINSVPDTERYPCVFLDPTLSFANKKYGAENGRNRPISALTRSELLQIGRCCNPGVLRHFGAILTRLTVVASAREMPDHISSISANHVAKVPFVLASANYNREFWKVLLHTIVPGTRLPARYAALLAALSLRMGIVPLIKVAEQEMLAFKGKWNDSAIPQTWNLGCLTLLLDADEAHQKQQDMGLIMNRSRILNPIDRDLFDRLVTYTLLEEKLHTQVTAQVPFTPNRTMASIPSTPSEITASVGPLVTCRECQYPRSVTIMGTDGKCGLCLAEYADDWQKEICVSTGVSKDVTATSKITWVKCTSGSCRAQYVIYCFDRWFYPYSYFPDRECYYCRSQGSRDNDKDHVKQNKSPAPTVQCNKCSNCIIWPEEYRTSAFKESDFICPLCTSGYGPITKLEVTPYKLFAENTFSWLAQGANYQEEWPHRSESIFQIISRMGTEGVLSGISFFPFSEPQLRYNGKPIRNSKKIISTLQKIVERSKTIDGKCSLCFSAFHYSHLLAACGRDGCFQKMCANCLVGWYMHNSVGRVINTAVLGCPFCRRYPTLPLVAKYRPSTQGVKDFGKAVRDNEKFIYAWCCECDTAKVVMNRTCMLGEPLGLTDWVCDRCHDEIKSERRQRRRRRRD